MSVTQCGDPKGAIPRGALSRAWPKVETVYQPDHQCQHTLPWTAFTLQILADLAPQDRQHLPKTLDMGKLFLLLLRYKSGMIEILDPAACIDPDCLQRTAPRRRNPNLFPGWRDTQRLYLFPHLLIGDRHSLCIP